MKVLDMIKILERDGWSLHSTRGSHRQYTHVSKPGRVTLPGHPADDLSAGLIGSILKQAALSRKDLHQV